MKLLEQRTYLGPSLYANFKVIRFTLDLGPLEHHPSATIPGFVEQLVSVIPSLEIHGCSYGEAGGFLRRLREDGGTWMGHVLEHVAIDGEAVIVDPLGSVQAEGDWRELLAIARGAGEAAPDVIAQLLE